VRQQGKRYRRSGMSSISVARNNTRGVSSSGASTRRRCRVLCVTSARRLCAPCRGCDPEDSGVDQAHGFLGLCLSVAQGHGGRSRCSLPSGARVRFDDCLRCRRCACRSRTPSNQSDTTRKGHKVRGPGRDVGRFRKNCPNGFSATTSGPRLHIDDLVLQSSSLRRFPASDVRDRPVRSAWARTGHRAGNESGVVSPSRCLAWGLAQ